MTMGGGEQHIDGQVMLRKYKILISMHLCLYCLKNSRIELKIRKDDEESENLKASETVRPRQ
jgi:hypothetical protein